MPYPVERLLEVNEDVIEVLLVLEVLLAQYPKVEDLLCCAASWSETSLFLSDDFPRLRLHCGILIHVSIRLVMSTRQIIVRF